MNIIFYKLQDEINDVKKTRTLTATATYEPLVVQGTLRGATSKVAPSIEFSKDITYFSGWNYCYIADFGRYYFVDNPISIRAGLTSLDMRVDVLTSFLTQTNINNIEGTINRCNNSSLYSTFLPDKKVQLSTLPTVTVVEPTSVSGHIENITFNVSTTLTQNVVLSSFNYDGVSYPLSSITVPTVLQDLPNTTSIQGSMFGYEGNCWCYILNSITDDVRSILFAVADNEPKQKMVYNLVGFPFEIPNKSTNNYKVTIGDEVVPYFFSPSPSVVDMSVKCTTRFNSGYLVLKDFNLTLPTAISNNNFLDYEPYNKCEIFIPFAGWTDINIKENIGNRIIVMYDVNYISGDAVVYVYNATKKILLYQNTIQMGVQYSLSTTNARDNLLKDQNYTRNLLSTSLVGSLLTVAGVFTENPYLIASGGASFVSGISNYANNENLLIKQGNAIIANTSGTSGIYGGLKVLLKWTHTNTVNYSSTTLINNFRNHYGLPTSKIDKLSTIPVTNEYHTYAEIVDLHTTSEDGLYSINDITYAEIEELKKLCAQGIYL